MFTACIFSKFIFSKIITTKQPPKSLLEIDTLSHWRKQNIVGFDIYPGTFALIGVRVYKFNFLPVYKDKSSGECTLMIITTGLTRLIMRYGLNKQDGIAVRKQLTFSIKFCLRL
jgi:hypothetical protein